MDNPPAIGAGRCAIASTASRSSSTLGQWPAMTSLDARKVAIDAQRELGKGHDPAKVKAASKIKADAAKADTVTNIC